jgi:hypothetical protein
MSNGGGQEGVADVTAVVTGVGELIKGFSSLDIHAPELLTALSGATSVFSPSSADMADSAN